MAYIGNTVQTQGFAPAVDYFNGDGTTVTFTLSRPVASVAQLTAVIDNVIQNPSSAFTVAGNAITFTSAPLSGTNNIWVEYTSLVTTYAAISQDPSVIGDITASGGYLSTGDFGNSYIDGTIVDYVTGNSRITTGPIDDMTFYHGGTASRSEMMKLSYAGTNSYVVGNFGVGTTTPNSFSDPANNLVVGTTSGNNGITIAAGTTGLSSIYLADGTTGNEAYRGYLEYGHTSDYLAFGTAASERMRIDASGYVTTPYQVAFHIRCNNNNYITTSPVPLNNAVYNIGSAWNTSTYTFTAPIGGRYMFMLQWYGRVTVANNGTAMRIIVNGTQVQYSDLTPPAGTIYVQLPLMSILNLSTGDTVQYTWSGNAGGSYYAGNQEMNLFGYLLG